MKLPRGEWAYIDEAKLVGYCLNRDHQRGRAKARVFASALGITAENASVLRAALREATRTEDAILMGENEFGRLYVVDFVMTTDVGKAVVRSGWMVRHDEDFPRLTTCYVL